MTDRTDPEALRLAEILEGDYCPDWFYEQGVDEVAAELRRQHARIAEMEAQLEAVGAGGVSGPMMGQPQEMPDLSALTENGAKAWAGVDAQALRDGVASAGSEPVAWRAQFDAWWARNRVSTHQVKNIGGFAAKVWHAALQTVVGATDSTAGFYPADEGSTPSRQATHPYPPEGMVGGWRPIETAPKDGVFLVYMQDEVRPARRMAVANWHPNVKIVGGLFSFDCATVTHWMPLPPPPTTPAGSGKGD